MENSKEKNPSVKEGKQMYEEEHKGECRCGKDCKCGCNCGDSCCCCRKKVFVAVGCLLLFLAGMGFNELLHCGRCPAKSRPLPPAAPVAMAPVPEFIPFPNEQGGTIIIVNTDGSGSVDKFAGKPGCGCKGDCKCGEKGGCNGRPEKAPRPHFEGGNMPHHEGMPNMGQPDMPKPDMPKPAMPNPVK